MACQAPATSCRVSPLAVTAPAGMWRTLTAFPFNPWEACPSKGTCMLGKPYTRGGLLLSTIKKGGLSPFRGPDSPAKNGQACAGDGQGNGQGFGARDPFLQKQ